MGFADGRIRGPEHPARDHLGNVILSAINHWDGRQEPGGGFLGLRQSVPGG